MPKPASPHWNTLYETAAKFRDLAPWQWLYDSHLFGVQHPDTGQIGWCSIMGNAGQHFALAVYRGTEGLDSFYNLADAGNLDPTNPEMLNAAFGQNCLMVSFEDVRLVSPHQKAHLKALGLTFRGAGQWIVVQSFDPGLHPWLPAESELPYLTLCIEQAMEVALRAKNDPDLLDSDQWFVRKPHSEAGTTRWADTFLQEQDLPAPTSDSEPVIPSKAFVDKTGFLKKKGDVAIANFFSPGPVQEHKDKRPWHPMVFLGIDPNTGMIMTNSLCPLHELPRHIESFLLELFATLGAKPHRIVVHNHTMGILLSALAQAADIELLLASGDEPYFSEPMQVLLSTMPR